MTDELNSRSEMRRLATMSPDVLIQEIEHLRTRNAELHRELQAAEAFVVDGATKLNARIGELEEENKTLFDKVNFYTHESLRGQIEDLRAQLAEAVEVIHWYADGFRIMDHIDGTHTIHETWYEKAREFITKLEVKS